jgi:hypothetical protein
MESSTGSAIAATRAAGPVSFESLISVIYYSKQKKRAPCGTHSHFLLSQLCE